MSCLITSPFSYHHGDGLHGLPSACKQSAGTCEEHCPVEATLHGPNQLICLCVGNLHSNFGRCAPIRIGMCESPSTEHPHSTLT